MIYDCFQFFNEIDILKLRMNILKDIVDKFVIAESTVTFTGNPKPLNFQSNRKEFSEFEDRIIYVIIDDTPDGTPFDRDDFQKNAVKRGLKDCKEDDIILYSDVDEIPNPEVIRQTLTAFQADKIYHFAQRMFYCFLNYEEITERLLSVTGEFEGVKRRKWLGTKMCSFALVKDMQMSDLRRPQSKENGVRLDDGGWHFGYMGDRVASPLVERVRYKIKSAAHTEFDDDQLINIINKNIKWGKDILGRRVEFTYSEIGPGYPEYLLENLEKYRNWILPPENRGKKIIRKLYTRLRIVRNKTIFSYFKLRRCLAGWYNEFKRHDRQNK